LIRTEFTAKIKLAAFERAKGHCEVCGIRIVSAEYDHEIPAALGGESVLENCVCSCSKCHRQKTSTMDMPAIAKAKRRQTKHVGAKRSKYKWPKRKFQNRSFEK
jgi:5-methylcytosine-specific restriction enzyme A